MKNIPNLFEVHNLCAEMAQRIATGEDSPELKAAFETNFAAYNTVREVFGLSALALPTVSEPVIDATGNPNHQ